MDSSTPRSPSVASSGSSVGPPLDASPTPTGSAAPSSPVSEVAFEGSRLTLGSIGDRCALTFEKGSTVRLELAPPCHVLVWNQPPPRLPNGRAQSGGEPIGRQGDAMAWKYATAHDAKVLAVIGDPVAEAMRGGSLFKLR
jgi:hypothetical protein